MMPKTSAHNKASHTRSGSRLARWLIMPPATNAPATAPSMRMMP